MVDIEDTIRATMSGAHYAPPPPRDLKPFLISANEILRADIPQKKFLVSSFIPSASFGMVFAPRGIGKSWFAFGLGKAIATGTDTFLGWQDSAYLELTFFERIVLSVTDVFLASKDWSKRAG